MDQIIRMEVETRLGLMGKSKVAAKAEAVKTVFCLFVESQKNLSKFYSMFVR